MAWSENPVSMNEPRTRDISSVTSIYRVQDLFPSFLFLLIFDAGFELLSLLSCGLSDRVLIIVLGSSMGLPV